MHKTELCKFLAKVGDFLQALVIWELAQAFEANLAKRSEFILDVQICSSHVTMSLNDAVEWELSLCVGI